MSAPTCPRCYRPLRYACPAGAGFGLFECSECGSTSQIPMSMPIVPVRNYGTQEARETTAERLLDLAMDDLQGMNGPERDAIVRVVSAIDRILLRLRDVERKGGVK